MTAWIGILRAVDDKLLRAVVGRRGRRLDQGMSAVTHLGDPAVVILLAGLPVVGVFPSIESAGVEAALALAGSHLPVQLLKRLIGRPRPLLPQGQEPQIPAPDRLSFPSGHAAAALAVALPLGLALPLVFGVPLVLLGAIVGVSRCYLGIHYPGDVAVGWFLALIGWSGAHWVLQIV